MKNLILHIPHSSTLIPSKEGYCVTNEILNHEILKLTDWYTDDLFENNIDISIKAPFSRIFCDTERFSEDSQEEMAKYGMGVLYEKTDVGEPLRNITAELRQHILDNYYWKHHKRLTESVKLQLQEYGTATIVDCHSFPQIALWRSLHKSVQRPDFNIGTDSYHTPQKIVEASQDFFAEKGYTCLVNAPYSGTMVPMDFFNKNNKVQSIMMEVNRRLYLKEPTNEKSNEYQKTKQVVQEFLNLVREML
jgi:N-formylglutamate amidohydrolase